MDVAPTFGEAEIAAARTCAAVLAGPFVGDAYRLSSGPSREILHPFDGHPIASVLDGDADAVDAAVQAARSARRGAWGTMSAGRRGELIRALADRIDTERLQLALLETLDVGKPIRHSYHDDVPTAAGVLRWYASLVDTAYEIAPSRRPGVVARITREPHGVVGIVLPWNYPLTTLALKIGPALAAGNTVVCKPADDTPLSTLRVAELAIEAGFPAGVINVVPGSGPVAGRAVGLHPDIAAINFTGSTGTGRQFLRYSADSNLKEVSLECGGKNAALILPDASATDSLLDEMATGFMMNSGQLCSSISRVLAPRHIEDSLRSGLDERMEAWPLGDPLDGETRIGPLVSDNHAAKVSAAIEAETRRNNDISQSRAAATTSPRTVAPIVFFNVDEGTPTWRDEIFGPVLAVNFYDDLDDAINRANATDYGLSAYLFGRDPAAIEDAAARLEAGFVSINAFGEGDFTTPFGGFRISGFGGKDKGLHSLDQYARTKSIWWAV